MATKLILKDGAEYEGKSFGADKSVAGEVVFATGMVGYPEALTDPSFRGQILVLSYPLIGNYGVPDKKFWESERLQVAGLIVSSYVPNSSHHKSVRNLGEWLKREGVPALEVKDTRALVEKLRKEGVMLGSISRGSKVKFEDPNKRNLAGEVSTPKIFFSGGAKKAGQKNIVLIDCGAKRNIARRIEARGFTVATVPWNTDVTKLDFPFSAVVISNGPGDPMKARATIANVKKLMKKAIPVLGICLGNQILALAGGGFTYKLKFGHRSQNQPAVLAGSGRAYLTTQNHGFSVGRIPKGFREWFRNGNDGTNEGIIHETLPFMSVQFHPESSPGPLDTDWIFDFFLEKAGLVTQRSGNTPGFPLRPASGTRSQGKPGTSPKRKHKDLRNFATERSPFMGRR
ncbi:MAG TPA: glutamine-hydrolyzing carbamoyl-phosphate synthase small subunit [Candidatus Paceibacterota bacterium]|nr:glutamine-hydrolyzing carbamoyl-phosphate synthase small subunit [Candidatus Paceibacterota bacterium]